MEKKISLVWVVVIALAAALLTFMWTYILFADVGMTLDFKEDDVVLDRVKKMYAEYFVGGEALDPDFEKKSESELMSDTVNAYIAAVGDLYGQYFTAEEYEEHRKQKSGKYCGIGVTVRNDPNIRYRVDRMEMNLTDSVDSEVLSGGIVITEVSPGSPASGMLEIGDVIIGVEAPLGGTLLYSDIGYENMISNIKGEEGLEVGLWLLRGAKRETCLECLDVHTSTNNATLVYLELERKSFVQTSVYSRMLEDNVAYIKITGFEDATPEQFALAVARSIDAGATDFVFDVRDNPGGSLSSVLAVLSTVLDYDKNADKKALVRVISKNGTQDEYFYNNSINYMDYYDISDGDKAGGFSKYRNAAHEYSEKARNMREKAKGEQNTALAAEYTLLAEKYERLSEFSFELPSDAGVSVIVNKNTASAAELFTQTLRDFGVSLTVGTTTYGKGSMQSYYNVSGISGDTSLGVLKMTANLYTSAYSESYNGVGIVPDLEVTLKGDSALAELWMLDEKDDAQLIIAYNAVSRTQDMALPSGYDAE